MSARLFLAMAFIILTFFNSLPCVTSDSEIERSPEAMHQAKHSRITRHLKGNSFNYFGESKRHGRTCPTGQLDCFGNFKTCTASRFAKKVGECCHKSHTCCPGGCSPPNSVCCADGYCDNGSYCHRMLSRWSSLMQRWPGGHACCYDVKKSD